MAKPEPEDHLTWTVRTMVEDAIPNLVRNRVAVRRVGNLARRADSSSDLADLKARQLPVLVLREEGYGIIPRPSFEALGVAERVLADPDGFGEVMANSITVARAARVVDTDGTQGSRRIVVLDPATP